MLLSQKVANALRQFFPSHTGGRTFYVDNSGNSKADMDVTPFDRLQKAIDQCVAHRGDLIIVKRGHAEAYAAAAALLLNKAGVTIRGEGVGTNRPTFTHTGTATDIDVSASDVTIDNLRFLIDTDATVHVFDVAAGADNFRMFNCDVIGNGSDNYNICVKFADGATDGHIEGCLFYQDPAAAGPTESIRLVGCDRVKIINNKIMGDFSTSVINGITTASLAIEIARNSLYNENAGVADVAIDLIAGCTGWITDNRIFSDAASPATNGIDGSSCCLCENYITDVLTSSGVLCPAAATP